MNKGFVPQLPFGDRVHYRADAMKKGRWVKDWTACSLKELEEAIAGEGPLDCYGNRKRNRRHRIIKIEERWSEVQP